MKNSEQELIEFLYDEWLYENHALYENVTSAIMILIFLSIITSVILCIWFTWWWKMLLISAVAAAVFKFVYGMISLNHQQDFKEYLRKND